MKSVQRSLKVIEGGTIL